MKSIDPVSLVGGVLGVVAVVLLYMRPMDYTQSVKPLQMDVAHLKEQVRALQYESGGGLNAEVNRLKDQVRTLQKNVSGLKRSNEEDPEANDSKGTSEK